MYFKSGNMLSSHIWRRIISDRFSEPEVLTFFLIDSLKRRKWRRLVINAIKKRSGKRLKIGLEINQSLQL